MFFKSRIKSIREIEKKVRRYQKSIEQVDLIENPLDRFIISLEENYITSEEADNYFSRIKIIRLIRFLFGVILFIGGLSIIIIPIPRHFEIATLLYFNPNDGITISDLIALVILSLGSYLLIGNVKEH